MIISPEHCRTLAKGASINLQGHWIGAEWDPKIPVVNVKNQQVQTGITAKQKAGFLGILFLSTRKINFESHDRM